jgi:RTX calcium-binding nonapeptide repeat (4 copies)
VKGRTRISLLAACLAAFALAAPATANAACNGLTPTQTGTGAGETINGTAGVDVIEGGGGNDTINGLGGNDTICGEDGDDTIDGGSGSDHMQGGTTGQTSGDTVTFVSVTAQLTADLQTQTATNTSGDSDAILQFENLTGTNTFDLLTGDGGDNVIRGLSAADGFEGLGGNDTLIDDVGGVSDQDTAKYSTAGPGGITGSLTTGTVAGDGVGTDTLTGFRGIYGSSFDDVLIGDNDNQLSNSTDNDLQGMGGNDVLEPLRGTDTVIGGGGVDLVTYANDIAIDIDLSITGFPNAVTTPLDEVDSVSQVENVTGSPENDTIIGDGNANVLVGLGGDDELTGGGGSDTASFSSLAGPLGVNVNLALGTAAGQGSDTLTTIENVTGSPQGDVLFGDGTPNVLDGLGGHDNVDGQAGIDQLLLGPGMDIVGAADGEVDSIDCTGGGPDSGSVDGPAPEETYTACDSDGDAVVDFLDTCPTTSGSGADGCVPQVTVPPVQTPAAPTTPSTRIKKCKKGFKLKKVKGKKKCVKKKKKR